MVKSILLSTLLLGTSLAADTSSSAKEEGISAIKALGSKLKGELKSKFKEDPSGVTAASFCADSAMKITKEINSKLPGNVTVRRTSLKTRNSTNKPDETDVKVMDVLAKEIAAKQISPGSVKVVEAEGATRVYKPLVTQKVCLKCHGSDISPEISDMLKKHYPEDQARGFKEGDLRGVIVAEVKTNK